MSLKSVFLLTLIGNLFLSCGDQSKSEQSVKSPELKVRELADTIGFAQYGWQMDSLIARIDPGDKIPYDEVFKAAICPHDDYAYAGGLYSKTLEGIKAKTIVLIGVAHKARIFNLENKLVFGSFDEWKSVYNNARVSPLRDKLLIELPKETYVVHDSMMQMEHSLEPIVHFLQSKNREIEIIPMLVPYFTDENMESISDKLTLALRKIMKEENLKFGEGLAIVISNDAIHYGDEGWGGDNMAPMGVDESGTEMVRAKEMMIVDSCLVGEVTREKIKRFNEITVDENNYKEYKWTWCGRYSIPFGLMLANKLNTLINAVHLNGILIDYRSSYHNAHLKVDDLKMGVTAPANIHHWVGYAGIVYK